jgi:outer membrane usher protein
MAPWRPWSGVRVNFWVQTNINAVVLVLSTPDGKPVAAGLHGEVEGGQAFVVGYDGRAYVKVLGRENTVVVEMENGTCRASFTYTDKANQQVVIQVICR